MAQRTKPKAVALDPAFVRDIRAIFTEAETPAYRAAMAEYRRRFGDPDRDLSASIRSAILR